MSPCRNVLRLLGALVVGGAVFVGAPNRADATFTLRLQSGASDLTVIDNDLNDITPGTNGLITYSGNFGDFLVTLTAAFSNNGNIGANPVISINNLSVNAINPGGGNLVLTVTDTSFTSTAPGSTKVDDQLSTTALANGSITYVSSAAGQGGSTLSLNTAPAAASGNYNVNLPNGYFTVQSITTIHLTGLGAFQGTGITTVETPQGGPLPTPAPAGIALALTGAPFLLFGRLRRRLMA